MTVTLPLKAASSDQARFDTQATDVAAGPKPPADHCCADAHVGSVGGAPTPTASDHRLDDAQKRIAASGGSLTPDQVITRTISNRSSPGRVQASPMVTINPASPTPAPSSSGTLGSGSADHVHGNTQACSVGASAPDSPPTPVSAHAAPMVGPLTLADPILALAAEVLDDLERVRIANENRLRQMTGATEDKNGAAWGFNYTLEQPDVAKLAGLVASMYCKSSVLKGLGWVRPAKKRGEACCMEHTAEANLTDLLGRHALAPWIRQQKGVGDKQAARLLAALGDPAIRPDLTRKLDDGTIELVSPSRPRLVSELFSYCGYGDAQQQKRRRDKKMNWSPKAKMRAYNVAASCLKQVGGGCEVIKDEKGAYLHTIHAETCECSPYRLVYEEGRERYRDTVHPWECDRCTPKGKPPAPTGSPRKPGHEHQASIRLATRAFLRDLWREARRLHEFPDDHGCREPHRANVAGGSNSSTGHLDSDTPVGQRQWRPFVTDSPGGKCADDNPEMDRRRGF